MELGAFIEILPKTGRHQQIFPSIHWSGLVFNAFLRCIHGISLSTMNALQAFFNLKVTFQGFYTIIAVLLLKSFFVHIFIENSPNEDTHEVHLGIFQATSPIHTAPGQLKPLYSIDEYLHQSK